MFKGKVFEYKGREIRQGADLSGADLSGFTWRDASGSLSGLKNMNFSRANLADSDFRGLLEISGNFAEANLANSTFMDIDLSWVNFEKANLTNATFEGVNFLNASFAGANLTGAKLKNCTFPTQERLDRQPAIISFAGANLTNSTVVLSSEDYFSQRSHDSRFPPPKPSAYFAGAIFDNARIKGTFFHFDFMGARFEGTVFESPTSFNRCEFGSASFNRAHFSGSETLPFSGEDAPCQFFLGLQDAKFIDVTGCAFLSDVRLENLKVSKGRFYIPGDRLNAMPREELREHLIWLSKDHDKEWQKQNAQQYPRGQWMYERTVHFALDVHTMLGAWAVITPQGLQRDPLNLRRATSTIETKLAEIEKLHGDGTIDKSEYELLRKKILGI